MKANAPEKIYVADATFPDYVDFDESPINTKKIDDHDIEYTRTDAFIVKAVSFLNCSLSGIVAIKDGNITQGLMRTKSEFIDEFKKYMKGE